MKKRIIIMLSIILLLVFTSGITYSAFNSTAKLKTTDQEIANFIFNAENYSSLDLSLIDLIPGEEKNYKFSVTNKEEDKISNVDIEYQIIIKTYHFIPLDIKLYKINGDEEELFGICDESSSRNDVNELVCNMKQTELKHSEGSSDEFNLVVKFPKEYNSESYSGLVDFLNIELKSWQKTDGGN